LPPEFLANMSEGKYQEFWAEMLDEEPGGCFVWERDSRVVGFANLGRILDVRLSGGKHLELYVIYFTPELYGSGEGTRFWKEIEAGLEAECVWVWCLEANLLGRRFYEKNGFSLVEGESKNFVWRDESFREIRYRKFL
jgi:GNAT superfamily N-acetyltransferase